jgi:hypothetical protein
MMLVRYLSQIGVLFDVERDFQQAYQMVCDAKFNLKKLMI